MTHRMRFTARQLDQLVGGAVTSGRIPRWRAPYYRQRLQAGGFLAGRTVTTLLAMTPAPPDVIASWDRDPRTASAASGAAAEGLTDEQVYALLYPTDEAVAAEQERRACESARTAQKYTGPGPYDNTLTAGAPPPPHGPMTAEHEHDHSNYAVPAGVHSHPHVHRNDNVHQPGAGHGHAADPVAAGIADPLAAGIAAKMAARNLHPDAERDYRALFGPPGG
jgi:hypothetical protein